MDDFDGRILEVRRPGTGILVGVCSGVREDGSVLHVSHMILCGSPLKVVEAPDIFTIDLAYWEFDLRDGNQLCYAGCTWDLWNQTFKSGEALVVCDGIVRYKEKGRGATDQDGS